VDASRDWIVVVNWDRFQHYKDRWPVWIKLYTELESKPEWVELELADQGLLVRIWMRYAMASGRLHVRVIHRLMPPHSTIRALRVRLDRLENLGFIRLQAARPLAQRREEKKKEESASRTEEHRPAAEARSNAGAYRKHERNGAVDEYVPLETIQAYSETLRGRPR
jgi:hypothetical protein